MSRGDDLLKQADKKANSSGGWFSSASSKWEDASELYKQAGHAYRADRRFADAGRAYERAAECSIKADEKNDAYNAYYDASKVYKQEDPKAALSALGKAIQLLVGDGKIRQAADRTKDQAGIYKDMGEPLLAAGAFEEAGNLYDQEDAKATSSSCWKEAAELFSEVKVGEYDRAVELYKRVANFSLTSPLTKYNVKDYFLRIVLCTIATGDVVKAQKEYAEECVKDVTFAATREGKFAKELIDATDDGDIELYTQAIFEFDQVTKLDNWKTNILLMVKNKLEESEAELT